MILRKGLFPLVAAACAGCLAPPVESPPTNTVEVRRVHVPVSVRNQVDILFMIDNSNSMEPKQTQLKARFPQFIQRLRDFAARGLPASYHIGVVTSDLGAGSSTACKKDGDGGRLNTMDRSLPNTPVDCGLGNGLSYIDFNQVDGTANVVDVEKAFQCIASVGDNGCGFEHPLESVRRALTTSVNQGFLRDDAALAVVFLTDEDDCSAPPDTDLFDTTKTGTNYSQPGNYGPLTSFRCTEFGILSDGMQRPFPGIGDWAHPSPAPFDDRVGKLFPVERYIDLFTQDRAHGGVKDHPDDDLMVIDIAGPLTPFRTILADPGSNGAFMPCNSFDGKSCTAVLDHSCHAANDVNYDGDPAVRLHAVVSAAANHDESTSICDDSYDQALEQLANFIHMVSGGSCLGAAIEHPDKPDIVVEETSDNGTVLLPWCGAPNATEPCWQLVERPECTPVLDPETGQTQQLGLEVMRSTPVEGDVHDDVECAIVAASQQ